MYFLRTLAFCATALLALSFSSPAQAQSSGSTARRTVPRLTPRLQPRPAPPRAEPVPPQTPPSGDVPPAQVPPPAENSGSSFDPVRPPTPTEQPPSPDPSVPVNPQVPGSGQVPPSSGFRPPALPVYPGVTAPPGYVEQSRFNMPFLLGGGLTLLVGYGGGLVYAGAQKFEDGLGNLAIPVLGPWLAVGKIQVRCQDVSSTLDPTVAAQAYENCQKEGISAVQRGVTLIGFGLAQMAGAVAMTIGLLDIEKQWVRADLAGVEVTFDAYTFPGSSGFVATGSF